MNLRKNRQGFSPIFILLIIAVILVIGLVGWRVTRSDKQSKVSTQPTIQKVEEAFGSGLEEAGIDPDTNSDLGSVVSDAVSEVSTNGGDKAAKIRFKEYPGGGTYMVYIPEDKTSVSQTLEVTLTNINSSDCSLSHKSVLDNPGFTTATNSLPVASDQVISMEDGIHTFTLNCKSGDATLTASAIIVSADRKPERCSSFSFSDAAITANTLASLKSGMVGNWKGCVTTPWLPPYEVTITFNSDGTYSALSTEELDSMEMNAMYYGMEEDSPSKKYFLNDFQASQQGVGEIDIVFDVGSINRGSLKNIKLMDNKLSLEFFHRNEYGPVKFELYRQ